MTTPYKEALHWIKRHPGTGSATSLAKLILSLWNEDCSFSFRECVSNLDGNLSDLAIRLVTHFNDHGEDSELVATGHEVCDLYPRLWAMSEAMMHARRTLREEWRNADEAQAARLYPHD